MAWIRRPSPHRGTQHRRSPVGTPLGQKPWTALFYLCGDHKDLEQEIEANLKAIVAAGSSPHLHVVVQRDRAAGAERFILREEPGEPYLQHDTLRSINTGDPEPFIDFLTWGMAKCPSEHVALVVGGMGIFHPGSVSERDRWTKRQLFSICDDESSGDALDIVDLERVLREVGMRFGRAPAVDLLGFDMCQIQFLEVAYQLEGLARVVVAPQTDVPGTGWAYDRVLEAWAEHLAHGGSGDPKPLAIAIVDNAYEANSPSISALDLDRLEDVTRAFDGLMLGMIQTLGEDLVWRTRDRIIADHAEITIPASNPTDVVYDLGRLMRTVRGAMEDATATPTTHWLDQKIERMRATKRVWPLDVIRDRIACADSRFAALAEAFTVKEDESSGERPGLLDLVAKQDRGRVEAMLVRAIELAADELPAGFLQEHASLDGQRVQTEQLATLATRLLTVLEPGQKAPDQFVVARRGRDRALSGVSVYRPGYGPGQLDDLMEMNYLNLRFHERIHWAVYLGAVNLIKDHPRALWRLVSSLMSSANPAARDDLLRKLVGPDSVMVGFKDQLRALASPPTLTLSLEPTIERPRDHDAPLAFYRVRLDADDFSATLVEQTSRVNEDALRRVLARLEALLGAAQTSDDDLRALESLGQTLGEDILQSLSARLEQESRREDHGSIVHLQLQLPRKLMRYPWELMHDRKGWLGDRFALGRQVFMDSAAGRWAARRRPGPIRALVIGDPYLGYAGHPPQLPGARAEAEQLCKQLTDLAKSLDGIFEFVEKRDSRIGVDLTETELRELLRNGHYDIIHFAGHACFDSDDPECSAWLLSDGPLWALHIRNTLAWAESPPWLVFASACQAAMDSERPRTYQQEVFGLATAFINQGVSAYIGPQWPIDDQVAVDLSQTFYDALLLDRSTLGEALHRAKTRAKESAKKAGSGIGWASLVLYGDPTAKLVHSLCGKSAPEPHRARSLAAVPEAQSARVQGNGGTPAEAPPAVTVQSPAPQNGDAPVVPAADR